MPFQREKKPVSARQRKLRARKRRRKAREGQPSPASQALRWAMTWQQQINADGMTRADIARREGVTRAGVTWLMSLLDLHGDLKAMLLEGHDDVADWSIRRALRAVEAGGPSTRSSPFAAS